MLFLCITFGALLFLTLSRLIAYYGTTLGLLYYLGEKHNDLLSEAKVKELRDKALERRIEELFRKG